MTAKSKQMKLLLLQDVENTGRSGDIVPVKAGYARNFLVPQGMAVFADKRAINMQGKLQEERAKQAALDKERSEIIASRISGITITTEVKIGPEGTMYGSVGVVDIVKLLGQEGITLEKKNVVMSQPIKKVGVYTILLRLKESVETSFNLKIISDVVIPGEEELVTKVPEKTSEETTEVSEEKQEQEEMNTTEDTNQE